MKKKKKPDKKGGINAKFRAPTWYLHFCKEKATISLGLVNPMMSVTDRYSSIYYMYTIEKGACLYYGYAIESFVDWHR